MSYVFDNIIPQGYVNQIEQDLLRTNFPWYYINDVTNLDYGNNSGLVHVAYNFGETPSEWYPFIKPLIYSIEQAADHTIERLLRIRIGFLSPTVDQFRKCNTPHVDFLMGHWTACYYVNDSDGDTVLFDKTLDDMPDDQLDDNAIIEYGKTAEFNILEQNSPKRGSVFLFDGKRFHASTNPKAHDRRLVITINYI